MVDLEAFSPEQLTSGFGVFLMATYGEGDPTDNAVEFHRWLTEEAGGDFDQFQFCVFGLGNRQYEHFNAMGRLVDGRLEELGAQRAYRLGEGDDDGEMDDDWEEWKADVWDALQAASGAHSSGASADVDGLPALPELQFKVQVLGRQAPQGAAGNTVPAAKEVSADTLKTIEKSSRPFFECVRVPVTANRQLRQAPSKGNATVHVQLDIKDTPLKYTTADNLGVLPVNSTSSVMDLAEWCGWDVAEWLDVAAVKPGVGPLFPSPCTVGHALAHYVDLHGPVSKSLVGVLAHFAEKPSERSRLASLLDRAAKEQYHAAISNKHLSVAEFLQEYPSVKPPLHVFLQLVPRLQPRLYTIASSSLVQPRAIDIAVSVIDRPKPNTTPVRQMEGVASTYIASCGSEGEAALGAMGLTAQRYVNVPLEGMHVIVRPSTFHLPSDASVPVILVGPGTGLAPMRAFLQERSHQRANGEAVGDTVLFFGCRKPEEDFIYSDELQHWVEDGTLTALHTAFSRAQSDKVYVQHRIREQGAAVWQLLQQGAHVYVCGATNMGSDVAIALRAVAVEHGGQSPDTVQAWFDSLHKTGRYVSELWSA